MSQRTINNQETAKKLGHRWGRPRAGRVRKEYIDYTTQEAMEVSDLRDEGLSYRQIAGLMTLKTHVKRSHMHFWRIVRTLKGKPPAP